MAVGVFIGLSPFWGFHTGLAVAAAVFFRLNKVITIVASNISIAPLIPFVVYAGHEFGALWMGEHAVHIDFNTEVSLETIAGGSVQYLVGSLSLALIVSIIFGLLTFFYLSHRASKAEKN